MLLVSFRSFLDLNLINQLAVILTYITLIFLLIFLFKTFNTTILRDEFITLQIYTVDYQQYFGDTLILLVLLITFFS